MNPNNQSIPSSEEGTKNGKENPQSSVTQKKSERSVTPKSTDQTKKVTHHSETGCDSKGKESEQKDKVKTDDRNERLESNQNGSKCEQMETDQNGDGDKKELNSVSADSVAHDKEDCVAMETNSENEEKAKSDENHSPAAKKRPPSSSANRKQQAPKEVAAGTRL